MAEFYVDKGIIYYTDNKLIEPIFSKVQGYILASGLPIVSCSFKPMAFGKNVVIGEQPRMYMTMVLQIVTALENLETRYVFFCEHDVLYHPTHFHFTPKRDDIYYYNLNNWRWDYPNDRAINYDGLSSLSMMCCNRLLALAHYGKRLEWMRQHIDEFATRDPRRARVWGYEAGTKARRKGGFSDESSERWMSDYPNIDIRHTRTFTPPKTRLESFRHPPTGWREVTLDKIPAWDVKNIELKDVSFSLPQIEEPTLSVIIPARNEMFLQRTVEDLLANIQGNTDIIVVLDGYDTVIPENSRLRVIHNPQPIGQRASMNKAVQLSEAKYIMKVDAHCAFDKGFDVKLMTDMQDDWTCVPVMRNLHVFNWVCENGHKRYQGPSGVCKDCGKPTVMDIVWIAKTNPQSTAYRFDTNMKFQYWSHYKKQQRGDLAETMSLQGSCFMISRDNYWKWGVCDEAHGSWGQQGTEVACATWLSGGRVICNKRTWYAHMFRTQGADFGFPYHLSGHEVDAARRYSQDKWMNNKHPSQVRPLAWLIDKFKPVPDWHDPINAAILERIMAGKMEDVLQLVEA